MLIYVKTGDRIIAAVEGTGDNLTEEDIKDGYNDYMMTSVYKQEGEELVLEDGGQLLTKEMVKSMNAEELAKRLIDYWFDGNDDIEYIVLDEKGE